MTRVYLAVRAIWSRFVPTQLPVRKPVTPEPSPSIAPWIVVPLAVVVLIGLTLRAPVVSDTFAADSSIDPNIPQHLVRIVLAHSAPVVIEDR